MKVKFKTMYDVVFTVEHDQIQMTNGSNASTVFDKPYCVFLSNMSYDSEGIPLSEHEYVRLDKELMDISALEYAELNLNTRLQVKPDGMVERIGINWGANPVPMAGSAQKLPDGSYC